MAEIENHILQCDACCSVLAQVPDDTLVQLAREAATEAFKNETLVYEPRETALRNFRVPESRQAARSGVSEAQAAVPTELLNHPRYHVVGLLGSGGMGAVYKAEHRLMERVVALKVISRAFTANSMAVERFRREVRTAAKLAHPNIVTAFDAEQAGELHFLVMEYVDGISLDRLVAQQGVLKPAQACYLIRQAAVGLQHAHDKGMIHRDIKPQNLMITRKGQLKILDFGLARLATSVEPAALPGALEIGSSLARSVPGSTSTAAGIVLGTPDYIAPEQAANAHGADIRADIYSLGCTLYFLLTGEPPFPGGTVIQKLTKHTSTAVPPVNERRPDVPPEVAAILARMVAKRPAERFQTPGDLAKALAPFAKGQSSQSKSSVAPSNDELAKLSLLTDDLVPPLPAADPLASVALSPLGAPIGSLGKRYASSGSISHWAEQNPLIALVCGIAGGAVAILALAMVLQRAIAGGSSTKTEPSVAQAPSVAPAAVPTTAVVPPAPTAAPVATAPVDAGPTPPAVVDLPMTDTANAKPRPGPPPRPPQRGKGKHVLLVIPPRNVWFDDFGAVKSRLNRDGVWVTTASTVKGPCDVLRGGALFTPRTIAAEFALSSDLQAADFDAVIFIGQEIEPFINPNADESTTRRLIDDMVRDNKVLAAVGAGQNVLAHHAALDASRAAGGPHVRAEYRRRGDIEWTGNSLEHAGRRITLREPEPRAVDQFVDALLVEMADR